MKSKKSPKSGPSARVVRESLDRKAAAELREAITSGELAPGERLTESYIAENLGLSRGTVRAALHRLVAEGLVVQNIYSSWNVIHLSVDDAWELYTLRASLEGLAGRLASEIIDSDKAGLINDSFEALNWAAENGRPGDLADADLNFHRSIVEASGHQRLGQHFRLIEGQLKLYIRSVNGLLPSPRDVANEHRAIVENILAGNAEQVEVILREHSLFYGQRLVNLMSE